MDHRLELPAEATALLVLAHGAGAGMDHPFLASCARVLSARGVGTFRYEFPYMEQGKHRPDPPAVAAARVREAVAEAARTAPGVPLFAGGKSFGGRMTSTAQAEAPLEGVRGLVFLGFPLHPPGRPGTERAAHLAAVRVPMLFVQGTRDEFAEPELLGPVVESLGAAVTLHPVEGGDHSFKVPKSLGSAGKVLDEIADVAAGWMRSVVTGKPSGRG
jgi:predicted alpha/beta-hydrolase family hydrolase